MENGSDSSKKLALVAIILASIALVVCITSLRGNNSDGNPIAGTKESTALTRMKQTHTLRVAYGGFPPYTIVDVNATDPSKRVKGICVDIMNEIAARHNPPIKLEWHNLNWETLRTDMMSGKFDLLADGLYQTVSLASDFALSEPFSYFGIGCAIVSKDDERFKTFQDLDRSDITIVGAVGWLSTDYAKKHLTKPTIKDLLVSESPFSQLDEVLHGRADVAVQDVPTVVSYARAHKDQVKALWVDNPPAVVAGGFAARLEDKDLIDFINVSLRILEIDGTLAEIDKRWKGLGHYRKLEFIPGEGLLDN